jgi:hypothetical protein
MRCASLPETASIILKKGGQWDADLYTVVSVATEKVSCAVYAKNKAAKYLQSAFSLVCLAVPRCCRQFRPVLLTFLIRYNLKRGSSAIPGYFDYRLSPKNAASGL